MKRVIFILLALAPTLSFAATNFSILKTTDLQDAFLFLPGPENRTAPFGWVCTERDRANIRLLCDDLGPNETEGPMEELQIVLSLDRQRHEYGLRHGILRTECRRIKRRIEKLVRNSQSYCVRGGLVRIQNGKQSTTADWVFDEIKSSSKSICEFNGC